MRVKITKTCEIRLNEKLRKLEPGEFLELDPEKARILIDAKRADMVKPGIDEYRAFARELGELDPRNDCWEWNKRNKPEMWRGFLIAFKAGNLDDARKKFIAMIDQWEKDQTTTTTYRQSNLLSYTTDGR